MRSRILINFDYNQKITNQNYMFDFYCYIFGLNKTLTPEKNE